MALMGAELLLYPTAIGSEPRRSRSYDSCGALAAGRCRAMPAPTWCRWSPPTGSAARQGESCTLDFYGSSFITDGLGEIVEQAPRDGRGGADRRRSISTRWPSARAAWGLFRDRRPDLYVPILSVDGQEPSI